MLGPAIYILFSFSQYNIIFLVNLIPRVDYADLSEYSLSHLYANISDQYMLITFLIEDA